MRTPPTTVALLATAALVAQLATLGHLQWLDAYVTAAAAAHRGCDPARGVTSLTRASPYVGATLVAGAIALALVRGMPAARIIWALAVLGVGLLAGDALKFLFARARPSAVAWEALGHSFPSGHTANAVLCVGATLSLLRRPLSSTRRDPLRIAVALAGTLFVVAVAGSRIYLGRHWLTDTTGAVLFAVAFLAATRVPQGNGGRAAVLIVAVVALSGFYLSAAAEGHLNLPSPSAIERVAQFRIRLRRPEGRARAGVEGAWVARTRHRPEGGYLRLRVTEARVNAQLPTGGRTIARLVVRPLRALRAASCPALELRVDGIACGIRRPLRRGWRVYAFPLPPLPSGPHVFHINIVADDPIAAGTPTIALRTFRVD
jgi:membrane-associated phospholipid phosphatase